MKTYKVEVWYRYNDEKDFDIHMIDAECESEAIDLVLSIYVYDRPNYIPFKVEIK